MFVSFFCCTFAAEILVMRKILFLLAAVVATVNMSAEVGIVIRDTLHGTPCRVYLPSDYDKGDMYPVLYLQHGMYGMEDDWTEQGHLLHWLDSLFRTGDVKDMVIVMPDNCPHRPTFDEEKRNATSGEWEKGFAAFMEETESKYRVSKEPSQRAIAGLSMGGYHTMKVASLLDGQFAYVGMFSPATFVHEVPTAPKLLWLGIGKEDFLYLSVQKYRRWLEAHHVEYTYYESTGGHTWPNWQDYLCRFLKQLNW